MDNRIKNRSKKSGQKKQLQKIVRLNDENHDLDNKYKLVSSELNHLKSHIQNLNHDLRNPLYGIIGMLDLMINEDEDRIEVQTCDLKIIKESAQALMDLVNDTYVIRGIKKREDESMSIDRNLSSAIREIHHLYLPMAQNKGISLLLSTHSDTDMLLPPNLFNNLIQITGNLVANAIKFTPSNGSVEVVFTLDDEEDCSMLKMIVKDTGKGMTPDEVLAFNKGKPVARSMGTNGEPGSGIGLLHVIEMVIEVDGRIFVKSEKGSGTTFSIAIPLLNHENIQ